MRYIILLVLLFCNTTYAYEVQYKIESLLQPVVKVSIGSSSGSGVIVCRRDEKVGVRTFILSNYHVIDDAIGENDKGEETRDLVTIYTYSYKDKGRTEEECTRQATIRFHSKEFDLSLLELNDRHTNLSVIKLLPESEKFEFFQKVWCVGFPGGYFSFAEGMVMGIERNGGSADLELGFMSKYINTNAPMWFGNSGGLLAREIDGEFYVAGIPTLLGALNNRSNNPYVNWCISIKSIRVFLRINGIDFIEDEKEPIPEFKQYPRPNPIKINIIPDFGPEWSWDEVFDFEYEWEEEE